MVQIVGVLCKNEHVRIHIRTTRNTTLHHPSTHNDKDTDQKHFKSVHFRTHLDQPRNCLYLLSRISVCALLNLCWSRREWVVAARDRYWTWRLWRATCRRASWRVGGFHRQRPWVAKQQCSSTCCFNQARRPVASLCRWEPTAFDARALGRDP